MSDRTRPRATDEEDVDYIEDDYDELGDLLTSATARSPGFRGALEDVQLRQSILSQLIEIRRSLRISQRVVAERMQTTQSAVSDLENGVVDSHLSTLQRYARAVTARLVIGVDLPHDSPWCDVWFYDRPRGAAKINDSAAPTSPRSSTHNWVTATSAAPVARLDEARSSFYLAR
jgi:transcriptional regulator with XRE-family HTH domain